MRHFPEYTIDFSGEPRTTVAKGRLNPVFPVVFLDTWRYVKARLRPWFHVRYHSSFPVAPNEFQTLHYIILHPSLDVPGSLPYELPHENDDPATQPKIFAACLETSDSRFFPPAYDEVREVGFLLRKIDRRLSMSSLTRLDFLTDENLGISDIQDQYEKKPDLVSMDFRPLEIRETARSKGLRRWAAKKARDAQTTVSD